MCSPISPAPADYRVDDRADDRADYAVDYRDALLAAVTEVAENSLFAFADVSDEATFDAAATLKLAGPDRDWLHGALDFSGSIAGRFELIVPEPLARRLCASFAGAETPDEIGEGDLVDFTGELANMMCGAWLTRAYRHEAFRLLPPQVRRGQPDGATPGDARSEHFYLSIDEAPIRLALRWSTADSPRKARADDR